MVPSPSRQEYLLCGEYGINVKGYASLSMALFQQVNQFMNKFTCLSIAVIVFYTIRMPHEG